MDPCKPWVFRLSTVGSAWFSSEVWRAEGVGMQDLGVSGLRVYDLG